MTNQEIVTEAKKHSLMDVKLTSLLFAARLCASTTGHVAEVGVYKGGSSMLLCRAFEDRIVFGFDTYAGMPYDDSHKDGYHKKGDFADTSVNAVLKRMQDAKIDNFQVVEGDFMETKEVFNNAPPWAFAHLDADIEQSTVAGIEFFKDKIESGGGIFFDDYGFSHCPGVKPAAQALLSCGYRVIEFGDDTALFIKV